MPQPERIGRNFPRSVCVAGCITVVRRLRSHTVSAPVANFLDLATAIVRSTAKFGAQSGSRTHKILCLRQARMPIPSSGQTGGQDWDRTSDLLHVKETFVPLNYMPENGAACWLRSNLFCSSGRRYH